MDNQVSQVLGTPQIEIQDGVPLVFFRENSIFGDRKPLKSEWLNHIELYEALSRSIETSHITGLQRVRGMWRIYLDNLLDKVSLISTGVCIRGKSYPILATNPHRLDGENTVMVRVKDVPLSADDGTITRSLILKELEVLSIKRDKLRVNGKLTNCDTGDRIVIVKTSSLKEPLPKFMSFGHFKGRVVHKGQNTKVDKCIKCLEEGHRATFCTNDWKCTICLITGHKRGDCPMGNNASDDPHNKADTNSNTENINNIPQTLSARAINTTTSINTSSVTTTPRKGSNATTTQSLSGQQVMDRFVRFGKENESTPANRKQNVDATQRTPPSPADYFRSPSKKNKHHKDKNG